jgi:transketolase
MTNQTMARPDIPGPEDEPRESPRDAAGTMRDRFYEIAPSLLDDEPSAALVLAVIGAGYLDPRERARLRERVIDVGIREQLLLSVAGGLALTGLRPIVHTFAPFLLERAYEQVKLDLGHQGVGALLVSAGASYDMPKGGETHFGRRDVALLDTLDGWTVHVPGHPDEAEALLRASVHGQERVYLRLADQSNAAPIAGVIAAGPGRHDLHVVRRGSPRSRATVIAVGPMLDRTIAATEGRDVTVLYAATVRPFDRATLRAAPGSDVVVLVEPYLAGTSTGVVAEALRDRPHRVLGLGVARAELGRYGTAVEHDRVHGLDVEGLRRSIDAFVD